MAKKGGADAKDKKGKGGMASGKKAASMAAQKAQASKGGKAKKKKWSKGKVKERANNAVIFDQATYDRLMKEIPVSKIITPSMVVDRLKVNNSLARIAIRDLVEKGLIKTVSTHNMQCIYTRTTAATPTS